MKKVFRIIAAAVSFILMLSLAPVGVYADSGINMYRMYNPNSGEHFYTADSGERDHLTAAGWRYEGIGWVAPASGSPVYRLYNPNAGDHHYTMDAGERDSLVKNGWRYEGIGWRSGGSTALYRQYNPNAKSGTHNYSTDKAENDSLVRAGWRAEGIGWYGIGKGEPAGWQPKTSGDVKELAAQYKNNKTSGTFSMYGCTGKTSFEYDSRSGRTYLVWTNTSTKYSTGNPYGIVNSMRSNISATLGRQPSYKGTEDYENWEYDGVTISLNYHEWPLKVVIYK